MKDISYLFKSKKECKMCGLKVSNGYNYCPNCGAKCE